jgi:hypothetical protein
MASTANLIGLGCPAPLAELVADGVFTAAVNGSAAGIRTYQAIGNVDDTTPTAAQIISNLGAAATVGSGFMGVIKDADTDTNFYLCISNGTSWYYLKFTKAV